MTYSSSQFQKLHPDYREEHLESEAMLNPPPAPDVIVIKKN
jgi:hypothetical protein